MRITDEMVVAASAVLYEQLSCDYEEVGEIANAALTAALADVPEPITLTERGRSIGPHVMVHEAMWRQTLERVAELEAKLAEQREHQLRCTREWQIAEEKLFRVRELAKAEFPSHFEQRTLAILDGKEGT
jgi:hypothetical protein